MTDQQPTAEQLERLARLRQRRAPSDPAPSTPSGNATGGRLAAAGIGVGALVGLVGFLGFDASTSGPSTVDPVAVVAPSPPPDIAPAPAPAPAPIRIVIHRVPATTVALPVTQVPVTGALDTAPGPPAPSTTAAPVELIATPIVETITVAAPAPAPAPQRRQPAATTTSSGS